MRWRSLVHVLTATRDVAHSLSGPVVWGCWFLFPAGYGFYYAIIFIIIHNYYHYHYHHHHRHHHHYYYYYYYCVYCVYECGNK